MVHQGKNARTSPCVACVVYERVENRIWRNNCFWVKGLNKFKLWVWVRIGIYYEGKILVTECEKLWLELKSGRTSASLIYTTDTSVLSVQQIAIQRSHRQLDTLGWSPGLFCTEFVCSLGFICVRSYLWDIWGASTLCRIYWLFCLWMYCKLSLLQYHL